MEMTDQQKAIHFETWEHIHIVHKYLMRVQSAIGIRALLHDQSKMTSTEEMATFAEFTPKLRGLTYGSEEYRQSLEDMGPAVRHHQISNSHHPEAHEQGIDGMTLIDLLEMLCDWKAATLRHADGDISKSLEINRERFGMSEQLYNILRNTAEDIEGY